MHKVWVDKGYWNHNPLLFMTDMLFLSNLTIWSVQIRIIKYEMDLIAV